MGTVFGNGFGYLAGLALAAFCLAASPLYAAQKLVSTDLCADQLVVALAEHSDIRGLSRWSKSHAISPVAEQAADLPALPASAEALILSGADVALVDPFAAPETTRLLKRVGMKTILVPANDDFPAMLATIRSVSAELGLSDKGEAFAAGLTQRLDSLLARRGTNGPLALYLRPDGGTAGAGTAVDAAFQAAGLQNAATMMGYRGWARTDLETLLFNAPDLIVASFFEQPATSWEASLGRHPVYRRLIADTKKIEVPAPLWACGGWPLIEAAETLRTALEKHP